MNIIYGYTGEIPNGKLSNITKQLKQEGSKAEELLSDNYHFGNACFNPNYPITLAENDEYTVNCDCLLTNRKYLEKSLNSTSHTNLAQLLLAAYKRWGEKIVNHLEGDFAIAIYDKKKQETLLIRDHLGIKPLFYYTDEVRTIFTGDFYLLIDNGLVKAESTRKNLYIHLDHPMDYNYKYTLFKDIYRLDPATYIRIKNNKIVEKKKYWTPLDKVKLNKKRNLRDTIRTVEQVTTKAIKSRMHNENIGVHLSGGIDSGTIAAVTESTNQKTVKAYTWSPSPEWVKEHINPQETLEEYSEYKYINSFLKNYNLDLRYSEFSPEECYEFMTDPQKIINPELEIPVMRQVKKDGVELMLSGWGGDEFFSLRNNIIWYQHFVHPLGLVRIPYFLRKNFRATVGKLIYCLEFLLIPRPIKKIKCKKLAKERNIFTDKKLSKELNVGGCSFLYQFFKYNLHKIMQHRLDLKYFSIRTEEWNRYAYRQGAEYSFPLLDKNLIELYFSIPSKQHISIKHNRIISRLAFRNLLPRDVYKANVKDEQGRFNFTGQSIKNQEDKIISKLREAQKCKELDGIDIDRIIKQAKKDKLNLLNTHLYTAIKIIRLHNFTEKYLKVHQQ